MSGSQRGGSIAAMRAGLQDMWRCGAAHPPKNQAEEERLEREAMQAEGRDPASGHRQSIPHEQMLAGLRQATRCRD
jgi:hypothetical protein